MNVLILGDSGFIAYELVKTLIKTHSKASEPLNIVGVDIQTDSYETSLRTDSGAFYKHIQCDCSSTTNNELYSIIPTMRPDVIINCAAYVGVDNVKENALRVGYNNFNISYHLCNALTQYKREANDQGYNPLIIFFSSSEVYGNTTNASVENHTYELFPETQRSSYALSKLLEENLYNNLKEYEYTNTVIMRLFNIVGETQTERFVLPKLLNCANTEERFVVTPTYRRFCHIDFLTDCVSRIIRQFWKLGKTTFPHLTNFTSFREENYVSIPDLVELASMVLDRIIYYQLIMVKPEDIIYRKSEKPKIPPMFLDHSKDIPLDEIIRRMHEARQ